ncbi:MAG: gliding motility-associated C-terminal domain-containing protein, partial [Bacteroidia bacterium]|nr:gliding motility-associated C-terminal domain-containing protein [Bacteroidia bacterium]
HWIFGDGSFANGDTVSKSFNKSGGFSIRLAVTYINNTGCKTDTIEKFIKINSQPVFDLGKDTQFCMGSYYELSPIVRPKSTLQWWNGSTAPIVLISNNVQASLTVTDSNLCKFSDTIIIKFVNCDTSSIRIPNVFTPGKDNNGDAINDLFETEFSGFDNLTGYIYNRWGMRVYDFEYPASGYWNGCQNNDLSNPCPSGTYYYVFKFTNYQTGLVKDVNGVVELIR